MELKDLSEGFLVASGEVRGDGLPPRGGPGEDGTVAEPHLRGGEEAAQGIVDMGIRAGLVDDKVAVPCPPCRRESAATPP